MRKHFQRQIRHSRKVRGCIARFPAQAEFYSGRTLLPPVAAPKGLRRDPLLLDEYVDQRLHWLHLLIRDKPVILGDGNEVDEAHVEDVMLVDVPERVEPMGMVEVGVATEHLLHNTLAVLVESLGEATRLANPLTRRRIRSGIRRSKCIGFVDGKSLRQPIHDFLGREHDWVMDLADNPFLNTVDEFGSRNLGSTTIHEPSVGQARDSLAHSAASPCAVPTYRPADIVGHVVSLQMGRPVAPFTS